MMTKQKLEYFKNLLDKTMVDLLDEANKTVNDMTTHNGNLPDPTDRAVWNRTGTSLFASGTGREN